MNNIKLPLVDLHVHLGGAIPVKTVWEILAKDGSSIRRRDLAKSMTYFDGAGPYEFNKFLRKFDILNSINWTEDNIVATIEAVVANLAEQAIDYIEIRFSINKYLPYIPMSAGEMTIFICSQLRAAGDKHGIQVVPILSVKYESSRDSQSRIMNLIRDSKVADCVVGLDLVGDEAHFDADFYSPIFKEWKDAGKGLLAHVGESQSAENVRSAILKMGVMRISHGIKAASSKDIMQIAKDNNVAFDVALTSNLKTGVIADLSKHPVKELLWNGCQVSLGTDDPIILDTNLHREFDVARWIGLSEDEINYCKKIAIRRAFEKIKGW